MKNFISAENMQKCQSLKAVSRFRYIPDGTSLDEQEVETARILARYQSWKTWLSDSFPHLTQEQVLFLMSHQDEIREIATWHGLYEELLPLLQYELEK